MAANVICSKCGQQNEADQTFCGSCGAFLEWSGQKVVDEPLATGAAGRRPAAADAPATPQTELAGLARSRATAPTPPPVAPIRTGPPRRSVPDVVPQAVEPSPAAPAAGPTIACPACGRANPLARNFCHSCGTLLHPKPREPMARRRRTSAGRYRLLSIILLVAILLVGSFLLTRLTAPSSGGTASPSPHGLVRPVFDG